MEFKDYYAILGVAKHASQNKIQAAYRKLARKYHPDVNQASEAEEKFKEIGEAYEILKDTEKRALYDRYGAAWKEAQQHGGMPPPGDEDSWFEPGSDTSDSSVSGFSSFFEHLFGYAGRPRTGQPGPQPGTPGWQWAGRGQDHEAQLSLTLENAAHGGQREISLTDPATGQTKTYMVNIPKGTRAGQRIRLAGQGGKSPSGSPAGDLYLNVDLQPHPTFRLQGKDLHTTLYVTPWESALGTEIRLATLGSAVNVKVPPGSSSGRKIRLRGKGFPAPGGRAGDLYAEIRIMVPKQLSEREKALFEALAETSSFILSSPRGTRT
ncbi:MAG: DnaJ C-terminal domain-containing protein [Candidatus Tectomicrobia bacterium]